MEPTRRVIADNPISPNHYARFKIQPLDFIMANGLGFCVGNVIKYVCRYDAKNGLEDLRKARSYLDRLIAQGTATHSQAEARLESPILVGDPDLDQAALRAPVPRRSPITQ